MASGPSIWREADAQRGGTIFNLPEEGLGDNRGLVYLPLSLFPIISLEIEVGSGFHSENPRKHFEHDAPADLKIILSSLTFRIYQLSRYKGFQIFIMTALSLC
jgi:hypothetical protein